jgi:hypothetical protein
MGSPQIFVAASALYRCHFFVNLARGKNVGNRVIIGD